MSDFRSQSMTDRHTPTPWFVSGVRFRMNGGEWHSINRYDEALKRDENVACVGYDSRTGLGMADVHFIVEAVNSHEAFKTRIQELEREKLDLTMVLREIAQECFDDGGATKEAKMAQRALQPRYGTK